MKNLKLKFHTFAEEMLFYPKWYHWPLIILLLPFSLIYMTVIHFKFPRKFEDLGIPVVSIGNIIIGGSGKTPFSIALANEFESYKPAVVLRGYGRNSKGLEVVSEWGDIVTDVKTSGDEAMEIALKTKALVIVSEDRKKGILKAKELGAGFVILDDGFDKPFKKLNIVLDQKIKNPFCIPAGGYRYPRLALRFADLVLEEGRDFKRNVRCPEGDMLISAISKPERLLKYCKMPYKFFPDHYEFKPEDIEKFKDKTIVTTMKDYVKLKEFNLNLKVIELNVEINKGILNQIEQYLVKLHKKG
ncbi:tetraacyldisaccharide 4'-kinase [Nautilia profundicola AmH]|uniref:Tetraacyldisaccharide 4'-kinase n=1 Tax=Nautilia profundicola (strain ATCC BAA-1463 / DSM 18972 / AmH) TaxID=598659 RepID=B9L8S5_NAUPA|nr:tetraacyldisaccharide 4'-kinase [Nautilia profundicola]ACM92489.1 tetraacyldisaccharide 4'-kinase [Nautilia profundicola AmH]